MASTPRTWAEGEKQVVATAIAEHSRVWFTLARGRLTEVFYPTPDRTCIRSLEAVVAVDGWLSAEPDDTETTYAQPDHDVPLVRITNTDRTGRYRIEKE